MLALTVAQLAALSVLQITYEDLENSSFVRAGS